VRVAAAWPGLGDRFQVLRPVEVGKEPPLGVEPADLVVGELEVLELPEQERNLQLALLDLRLDDGEAPA